MDVEDKVETSRSQSPESVNIRLSNISHQTRIIHKIIYRHKIVPEGFHFDQAEEERSRCWWCYQLLPRTCQIIILHLLNLSSDPDWPIRDQYPVTWPGFWPITAHQSVTLVWVIFNWFSCWDTFQYLQDSFSMVYIRLSINDNVSCGD